MKDKVIAVAGDMADYAAACAVGSLYRSANPASSGKEPYYYVATLFLNADDMGLLAAPIHQSVITGGEFSPADLRKILEPFFNFSEFEERTEFIGRLDDAGIRGVGYAERGEQRYTLAILKESSDAGITDPDAADRVQSAVEVFDTTLRTTPGFSSPDELHGNIRYFNSTEKAWEALDTGTPRLVRFAPAIPIDKIRIMISSGQAVPERLFDIFPHFPVGCVFQKLIE
jgi:hypothetical protein